MIIVECAQGSEEWHKARAGVITASMFGTARARLKTGQYKGFPTAAAFDYAFKVAIERIAGQPLDEGFQTWQMKRGNELEPIARMEHEVHTGLLVERAGFVLTDDQLFGASADGLIGEDGGSEYKCLVSPERLRSVLVDGDYDEFKDQVQGCMWITGRQWWHLCFYCPALAPIGKQLHIVEMKRDDDYIFALEQDLLAFAKEVDRMELALKAKAA